MDKRIEELIGNTVEVLCGFCFPYVCSYWNLPPLERIEKCKPLKEGLNKLANPDLVLIDREKELPNCIHYRFINLDKAEWEYDKESMKNTCPLLKENYLPVIPLSEAMKEVK